MDLDFDYRKPLLTVVGAVLANLTVVGYSQSILGTNPGFQPLTYGAVGVFTAISAVGGWIVLELKKKHMERPYENFLKLSGFVLIASFATVLYATKEPGAGMVEITMLSLTHVVAAVSVVGVLLKLEVEEGLLK